MENVVHLVEGYDRSVHPKAHVYRRLTLEEVKGLRVGQTLWFVDAHGKARQIRVNGAVKLWERDRERVEVPLKYGMFECARWDGEEATERLLVRVEGE